MHSACGGNGDPYGSGFDLSSALAPAWVFAGTGARHGTLLSQTANATKLMIIRLIMSRINNDNNNTNPPPNNNTPPTRRELHCGILWLNN